MQISKIFRTAKISPKQSNRTKICPNESDSDYFGFLFILKLINFQSESVRISPNNFFRTPNHSFRTPKIIYFHVFRSPKLSETVRNCPIGSDRTPKLSDLVRFGLRKGPTESDTTFGLICPNFGLKS